MRGRTARYVGILVLALVATGPLALAGGKGGGKPGGGGGGEPPADPAILWTDTSGRSGMTWQVLVADADGSNARVVLAASGDGLAADPAWAPDGSRFAYRGDDDSGSPGLFVAPLDGASSPLQVASGTAYWPTWSPTFTPDGTERILFAAPSTKGWDLYAVTPDSTDEANLTGAVALPEGVSLRWLDYPTWSPGADKVAARYVDYDADSVVVARGVVVYTIASVGGVLTASVTQDIPYATLGLTDVTNLDWARSGTKIACSAVGGTYSETDIWVFDTASPANPTNVTKSGGVRESWPTWSPNGTTLLYTRYGSGRKDKGLFAKASNGTGEPTAIVTGGGEHYRAADWLRD